MLLVSINFVLKLKAYKLPLFIFYNSLTLNRNYIDSSVEHIARDVLLSTVVLLLLCCLRLLLLLTAHASPTAPKHIICCRVVVLIVAVLLSSQTVVCLRVSLLVRQSHQSFTSQIQNIRVVLSLVTEGRRVSPIFRRSIRPRCLP